MSLRGANGVGDNYGGSSRITSTLFEIARERPSWQSDYLGQPDQGEFQLPQYQIQLFQPPENFTPSESTPGQGEVQQSDDSKQFLQLREMQKQKEDNRRQAEAERNRNPNADKNRHRQQHQSNFGCNRRGHHSHRYAK